MFALDKIIFIKAIMLSRRSERWKPGRQFFPEIDKLFVQCSRNCMKSNFPRKVFVWNNSSGLVKGTLDNAAVHFCHYLETFFSSKSEIFYGNIFLEKKTFFKNFVRQVWRIFDHLLKLFVNSEAFPLKFEENVGKYHFLKMVLEGFFQKSTKYSLKSQKK